MAKKGLELKDLKSLQGPIRDKGWVLCIGAGTSGSMYPDWGNLAKKLMQGDHSVSDPSKLYDSLREKSFSLEGLIQATRDRLGLNDDLFAETLSKALYSHLPTDDRRRDIIQCLTAKGPSDLSKKVWQGFVDYVFSLKKLPSAVVLAKIVHSAYKQGFGPSAILTLNAEPLFYALINAHAAILSENPVPNSKARVSEPALLDAVVRSTSSQSSKRIPYYFCHGLLRVDGAQSGLLVNGSHEKLVFSESEYLEIANNSFSWQAGTFTSLALSRSMIFVGLSFTDTNLRKWLSWIYFNKAREIKAISVKPSGRGADAYEKKTSLRLDSGASTSHYWVNIVPKEPGEKEWTESMVSHLGVRMVWVESWDDVGTAVAAMVGVKKETLDCSGTDFGI